MSQGVQAINQPVEHTIAIAVCRFEARGCWPSLELVVELVAAVGKAVEGAVAVGVAAEEEHGAVEHVHDEVHRR